MPPPESHALYHAATKRILYDARGIPCGTVCDRCEQEVRSRFRPEIFTDPNYEADEAIDGDDWFEERR